MGNKDKSAAGGAVRKTAGDGAKAPASSAPVIPAADEVPGGAAIPEAKAPVVDTEADKKAQKAINDKASKARREEEKLADEVKAIEAAAARGHFIADGNCISCSKGNLGPGERVKAEYFGVDGEAVLKRLVETKAVKEVK